MTQEADRLIYEYLGRIDALQADVIRNAVRGREMPQNVRDGLSSLLNRLIGTEVRRRHLHRTPYLEQRILDLKKSLSRMITYTKNIIIASHPDLEMLLKADNVPEPIMSELGRRRINRILDAAGSEALGLTTSQQDVHSMLMELGDQCIAKIPLNRGYMNVESWIERTLRNGLVNAERIAEDGYAEELGLDVIYVKPHPGSRPLCEPYQGRYWSMSGREGYMTLADGTRIHYGSIYDTSYGEIAGLFGINCRHTYHYVQEGGAVPHDDEIPKEENDRIYRLEQKQAAMERKIRAAKRQRMFLDAGGRDGSEMNAEIRKLTREYRKFGRDNNIPDRDWRIRV